jgi:hypothetical protein
MFSMLDSPSLYIKEGNRLADPIAAETELGIGKCRKFGSC